MKKPGPAPTITTRVDPARRRQYLALMKRLAAAKREEAQGFDEYWEAVGAILDGALFTDGGYDTAQAFLAAEVPVPARTALRMVRVARFATADEEARYGTAVLDAALGYLEASTGGPVKAKLPVRFEALRIPAVREGVTRKLGLDELTVAELRAATRKLSRGAGTARARPSPTEQALADALSNARGLEGASVRVTDGMVHLGSVPVYALAALGRVLAKLALPALATKPAAAKKKAKTKR